MFWGRQLGCWQAGAQLAAFFVGGARGLNMANEQAQWPSLIMIIGGGFIALCVGSLIVAWLAGVSFEGEPPATGQEAAPGPARTAVPREPSPAEKMQNMDSIGEAIKMAKPMMSDTVNDVSPGASLFTIWAASKMKWSDLIGLPTTKFKLVMKDPDEERGKKICVKGKIIEIHAEKTPFGKIYSGGLARGHSQIYRFTAVGSTGELVAKSRGKICGIVIGQQSYSNSIGGVAHAVYLVGMFLLPENTKG